MYQEGKQYSGTFAGIRITFTFENLTEKTAGKFNRAWAENALLQINGGTNERRRSQKKS